jgi:5-methyltetrahydrofolate--homocysteine methyltransferase
MKQAVTWLEPFMERAEADQSTKVLLATVQGDVHDIGKNLVDIILSNNGYTVYNLGIKVPAEVIIQQARECQVDMIGLSGLLVKSAMVMQESMSQYRTAGLDIPILVGGAALTRKFVATSCVPLYNGPVVYCADAFAGLKAVQDFEKGHLETTHVESTDTASRQVSSAGSQDIRFDTPVPKPPFTGLRHVTDIDVGVLFEYVNEQALFRGRWGYRRGKLSAEDYQDLVQTKVIPIYEALKRRSLDEILLEPKVAYGYFQCWSQGNALYVEYNDQIYTLAFPRQASPPHLCIADYFRTQDQGGDIVGFFVATIGEPIGQEARRLYESDQYHDYLMLHGFGVEVTDALAEYWHEVMRHEWGIGQVKPKAMTGYVTQQYQGSRYGFGYPACPDLGIHETLWQLLEPNTIGISLTESMEMVPEQSTSAIVVHHPQAKYFSV